MRGRKPHRTARREALEEAGLEGRISKRAFGSFRYRKREGRGSGITCEVDVLPLRVERQRRKWREMDEREIRWFSVHDAVGTVEEPELRLLIERFSERSLA